MRVARERARHLRRSQRLRLIGGNGGNGKPNGSAWASTAGADGMILKFAKEGKFVMMIGGPTKGADSNNKDGGKNATPFFFLPADVMVDPSNNRLYVSDGYGNRRVVMVDAATGKYRPLRRVWQQPGRRQGARGGRAMDERLHQRQHEPAFFRNPVHCVKVSKEGLIYVCDRGNNRIQVFNSQDPNLGKECANPSGEAGKCGFVKEQQSPSRQMGYRDRRCR